MDAAFEAGGAVLGILAESLSRKLKRPDVRRAVYDGSTVMCTPYSPDAPFSAGNAMGRNKLIYAQAALTVVVASDAETGGTWSGATEALKHGYGPVAVWRGDGEGPGNEPLQQRGANTGVQPRRHRIAPRRPGIRTAPGAREPARTTILLHQDAARVADRPRLLHPHQRWRSSDGSVTSANSVTLGAAGVRT